MNMNKYYSSDKKIKILHPNEFLDSLKNFHFKKYDENEVFFYVTLFEKQRFFRKDNYLGCIYYKSYFPYYSSNLIITFEKIDMVDYFELIEYLKKEKQNSLISKFRKLKNLSNISSNETPLIWQHYDYINKFEYLKNKYVVLDVETNGIRTVNDDLLQISIYNPDNGLIYNRYLPLDLQPILLTKQINGLSIGLLNNQKHLSQDELDDVIKEFDLKNRIVLTYGGGEFDKKVLLNYCKRHNLFGLENVQFQNIKDMIPFTRFDGHLSKDNMCNLFGIDGVTTVHNSINDCILEWKLFECLNSDYWCRINNCLFKYDKDYIVPVSYLNDRFAYLKKISLPEIKYNIDLIYECKLNDRVFKKFDTNINGMIIENSITYELNAQIQDNIEFLAQNKSKLKYLNKIDNQFIEEIAVEVDEKGYFVTDEEKHIEQVSSFNDVGEKIRKKILPLIEYLKRNIFKGDVLSQEMVITDNKILALCDLSDEENVVEIKTTPIFKDQRIKNSILRQLYYQSRNRNTYILFVNYNMTLKKTIKDISVSLYKILLKVG